MNSNDTDIDAIRHEARKRSRHSVGNGFISLGYPGIGLFSALFGMASCVIIGAAFVVWTRLFWMLAAITLLVDVALSTIEAVAVRKAPVRPLTSNPLRAAFIPITVVQCVLGIAVFGTAVLTTGKFRMASDCMAPDLRAGKQYFYRNAVDTASLVPDQIVLFRLNPDNGWTEHRVRVVARLLAVPGDKISVRTGRYMVNGRDTGKALGAIGKRKRVLTIPNAPRTLTVPDGCYFVVQEAPKNSHDSQVLNWARRDDIVSTQIYHFFRDGTCFKRVE